MGFGMKDIIGTAKIIYVQGSEGNNNSLTQIDELRRGISNGQVSLLLTFHGHLGTKLFNKYISNNNNIPHAVKMDPKSGKQVYEVYIFFWPKYEKYLFNDVGQTELCEFSATMDDQYVQQDLRAPSILTLDELENLITPLKANAQDLHESNKLLQTNKGVFFGPKSILNLDMLKTIYTPEIANAAIEFAKVYNKWRAAAIDEQNIRLVAKHDKALIAACSAHAASLKFSMQVNEVKLKDLMFPMQHLSHDQFIQKFTPFLSKCTLKESIISLPIVRNIDDDKVIGLALEPMLQYVHSIADTAQDIRFNAVALNRATIIYNTLWAGALNSPFEALRKYLGLAWYVEKLKQKMASALQTQFHSNLYKETFSAPALLRFSEGQETNNQNQPIASAGILTKFLQKAGKHVYG